MMAAADSATGKKMFGDTADGEAQGAHNIGYKGFIMMTNAEKSKEVLQSQLASLAATIPSFTSLGH